MTADPFPSEPLPTPAAAREIDPARWVDEHGDYLFHYALSRLRDPVRAEDFVQEAFLAALKSQDRFAGRSTVRTWLTGILRNKLLDHFRRSGRETSFTDLEFYADEERESFDAGELGAHWRAEHAPGEWDLAGANLDREVFWKAFQHCSGRLPANVSRVFLLRELDGLDTGEICAALDITPNNLWVMLHRARLALRRCLETTWFGRAADEAK